MGTLDGKVAIVTGVGRPDGIGEATALKMAEEGANVVISDICRTYEGDMSWYPLGGWEYLESVAKKIEDMGRKAKAFKVDITKKDEIEEMVKETVKVFNRIDILVNNAGSGVGVGPFLDIPEAAWDKTMEVNVKGTFYCMRAVIPEMLKVGGGRIINLSSTAGLMGPAEYGAYSPSKFAIIGMTQTVALEYAPKNILINAVCPHFVETSMGRDEYQYIAMLNGITPEEAREKSIKTIPIGRPATGRDIADVIYFLASPLGSYMVGQAVPITGGGEIWSP
ncbi:MAG: SDR family oxidoreductase [Deltaproteobacteria bacterium]|uniref:SDR family oxidoreductase n=1 Tax=Candidatus Zymogenus saltonus TaxID=2844893 RepID=A0A9D8PP90_9DELT|nr:SDR family oxidoreductase [Candidatus Zymogenus saltonus]